MKGCRRGFEKAIPLLRIVNAACRVGLGVRPGKHGRQEVLTCTVRELCCIYMSMSLLQRKQVSMPLLSSRGGEGSDYSMLLAATRAQFLVATK